MTRHEGSNPARISDELMLGYVEGELSAEDEHRLESSLSREMLATLLAMRADAEGLRSMSDLKAPAGLLSGVADLIEREMLLGVRESLGAESDELPVLASSPGCPRTALGSALARWFSPGNSRSRHRSYSSSAARPSCCPA